MFIKTPKQGYHYTHVTIEKMVKDYKAKYLGPWAYRTKDKWFEIPVDVFYLPDPEKYGSLSSGEQITNYLGMYNMPGYGLFTLDAKSAFSVPIIGIKTEDGEVLVSRFRHDCVKKGPYMIDGGRDYLRTSSNSADGKLVKVTVVDGEFQFEVY